MKKIGLIGTGILIISLIFFFAFKQNGNSDAEDIIVPVKKGKFVIDVNTPGELEAKNSVEIQGPMRLRDFQIYQITISRMVDEGTMVKKGDWVADLDHSDYNTKFQDAQLELEKSESKYVQTQLDTALQMRQARDELVNLKYDVEQAKLVVEQSKYEPPATIKQNEYNLDKARRAYQQALDNYKIKLDQNKAKMQEVFADKKKQSRIVTDMRDLGNQLTIMAPEAGMVVYKKDWDGKPIKAGSQISAWNPTVATLTVISNMLSKVFINEVDVRKVKPGQHVDISLDAFPDKKLTGTVLSVANVGEQRPNSDAKVFESRIEVTGTDYSLRPSMTTANRIIVKEYDSALYIPLECLHSKDDSITYVYRKNGIKTVKQEVEVGQSNENAVMILKGLAEEDRVYLSVPAGYEDNAIVLLPEMNGKRNKDKKNNESPGAENAVSSVKTDTSTVKSKE